MQVMPSTLKFATIRVFKVMARDVAAVEACELKEQWETTGLRQSDYPLALDEMTRSGLVRTIHLNAHVFVVLTDAGLAECQRSRTPLLRRMLDWLTLERIQWRRTQRIKPKARLRRRRNVDQHTAVAERRSGV